MEQQEQVRAAAQQQHRIERTQQLDLFASESLGAGEYYSSLRTRYLSHSHDAVRGLLQSSGAVSYDDMEEAALQMPMTWVHDVQSWIRDWKFQGNVRVEGLAPKERTLKPDRGHGVVWTGPK